MFLKVAALQTDIAWEEKEENFSRIRNLISSNLETDILVLPETFSTGFTMKPQSFAEPEFGDSETFLQGLAQRTSSVVGGSWIEKNPHGNPFNTLSFFSPTGVICRYRKIHPFSFAGEDKFYSSGNKLKVFQYKGFFICPLICYDLRFPELFRKVVGKVDLFLIVANWPAVRIFSWLSLLKARAIENMAYVIGVNRVGVAGKQEKIYHNGYTAFFSPYGEEKILYCEKADVLEVFLSKERLLEFREQFPYIKDIRKELYEAENFIDWV